MGGVIQTVQHQHVKWRSIYPSMIPCLPSSPMFTFCLSHSAVQRIWGWWNSYCRLYHVNCPWWTSWASSEVHTTPLVLFYLHTYLSPNLPIHHTPLTTSSHTAPLTYRTPPTSHSQYLPILHPLTYRTPPTPTHTSPHSGSIEPLQQLQPALINFIREHCLNGAKPTPERKETSVETFLGGCIPAVTSIQVGWNSFLSGYSRPSYLAQPWFRTLVCCEGRERALALIHRSLPATFL